MGEADLLGICLSALNVFEKISQPLQPPAGSSQIAWSDGYIRSISLARYILDLNCTWNGNGHDAHGPSMDRLACWSVRPLYSLAGLVSANQPAQTYGKVEIKASRNEQKEAKALQAPPEEAARPQLPSVPVPSWAGKPSGGTVLNVVKSGVTVDRISLTEAMTVLGRAQTADYVLDHQSISRQHAAVCCQKGSNKWFVIDLHSAHGTTYAGHPVKSQPVELKPGVKLQFGASTRAFYLEQDSIVSAAQGSSEYASSGRSDTTEATVGPQSGYGQTGKYANAVQETFILQQSAAKQSTSQKAQPPKDLHRRISISQPLRSGLYDYLPAPEHPPNHA